ncbi:Uncharacterised protein [Vibrio cholerae]|nr:Uncharacterised protein [Vibrio cholerae]
MWNTSVSQMLSWGCLVVSFQWGKSSPYLW